MHFKQVGLLLFILIVLGAGFGFWASQSGVGVPGAQEAHILSGTKTEDGDYKYTEEAPYYTIEVAYPAKTPLLGEANTKARLTIEQALADHIAQFKKNSGLETLTEEDVRIQGLGDDRKYALDMQYHASQSPEYVSYGYTLYEDTLGAHPNGYFMTFVFDKNGERVALSQLFPNNPNWLEELSLVVSNEVVAQMQVRTGQDDVTGSVFDEGLAAKEENFQNFVIDGEELVILIPPYQVAPYAAGVFEVRIPLKDLQ